MRVSLKAVSGVDSVDVSLDKGLAVVKMKPGNTATLKQLNDAITKNGFTMKDSEATVAGTVINTDGKAQLRISGSGELLNLLPEPDGKSSALANGKAVVVEGEIPEPAKGRSPETIHSRSIKEEQSK